MELNSRELIKKWLLHVKQNNIVSPSEGDVKNFLISSGWDNLAIERAFGNASGLAEPAKITTFSNLSPKLRELYQAIAVNISKMSKGQRKLLAKELSDYNG